MSNCINCHTNIQPWETHCDLCSGKGKVVTIQPCGCWSDELGNSEVCEKHKKKSKEEVRKQ